MPTRRSTPALVALLAALAPAAAAAQIVPTAPAPRVGVLAGLNSATFSEPSDADDEGGSGLRRRTGLVGGAYATLPLGASGVALRPELLYAQKGASFRASFAEEGAEYRIEGHTKLSYLEVPVLLQYAAPASRALRPQLYAGPAFAYRVACRVEVRESFNGETERLSQDCDDADEESGEDAAGVRRFDLGGVVGGALAFDVGGRALAVGVRYTHGFSRLAAEEGAPRNRVIGLYGGVEFPVGRRR